MKYIYIVKSMFTLAYAFESEEAAEEYAKGINEEAKKLNTFKKNPFYVVKLPLSEGEEE